MPGWKQVTAMAAQPGLVWASRAGHTKVVKLLLNICNHLETLGRIIWTCEGGRTPAEAQSCPRCSWDVSAECPGLGRYIPILRHLDTFSITHKGGGTLTEAQSCSGCPGDVPAECPGLGHNVWPP